jgi:hypothetical protein
MSLNEAIYVTALAEALRIAREVLGPLGPPKDTGQAGTPVRLAPRGLAGALPVDTL